MLGMPDDRYHLAIYSFLTRLDAVEDLLNHPMFEKDFTGIAKGLPDLERIVSRIHAKNCKVKDFIKVLTVSLPILLHSCYALLIRGDLDRRSGTSVTGCLLWPTLRIRLTLRAYLVCSGPLQTCART